MARKFLHIARRGGGGLFPENTLPCFANAVRLGCSGAHLEVHLSRDSQVVVHAGPHLNPTSCQRADGQWISQAEALPLREMTYDELAGYTVGRFNPSSRCSLEFPLVQEQEAARIPRLSDVIELVQGTSTQFLLVIELGIRLGEVTAQASMSLVEAVLAVLDRHRFLGRAVLTSMDWGSLVQAKRLEPGIRTWFATIPTSWFREVPPPASHGAPSAECIAQLRALSADGEAPWFGGFDPRRFDMDVPAGIRAAGGDGWLLHSSDFDACQAIKAHRQQLPAIAWFSTRTDPVLLHRLLVSRVDGVCSDYPDLEPIAAAVDIEPMLKRARAADAAKKYREAIEDYGYVVDRFPRYAPLEAFVRLAVAQRMGGDLEASSRTLEACQIAYPMSPEPLIESAVLSMHRADWQSALAVWEKLHSWGPLSAQNYNRAARVCEVLELWDLHACFVREGLSRFSRDQDLRQRELYSEAHANLARGAWRQAVDGLASVKRPSFWPFAVKFYKKQAEIEWALSAAATDAERLEILHACHFERTALPWPENMAGIANALSIARRTSHMDDRLVEALLSLVEVMKNSDVDIKAVRSEWMRARVESVARASTQDAVDSLSLPAPYFRAICRVLLRYEHLQSYWRFREKYVESLRCQRVGAGAPIQYPQAIEQVLLANECGDHDYFFQLRRSISEEPAFVDDPRLAVLEMSRYYHSSLPFSWSAPFDETEEQFAKLVSGKSIAVVGPVATEELVGDEIDSFDLVLRLNHRNSVRYAPERFGRRTNLSWYLHSVLPSTRDCNFIDAMNDLDFVVVDEWSWRKCPWLGEVRAPKRGRLECWHDHSNPMLFGTPNGVQRTLMDLARFDVKRVKVFNSNLFLNTQYAEGYRKAPPKTPFTAFSLHDPVGNFVFLKRLRDLGTMETDGVLGRILSMSAKDYVDALQAQNPSDKATGDQD